VERDHLVALVTERRPCLDPAVDALQIGQPQLRGDLADEGCLLGDCVDAAYLPVGIEDRQHGTGQSGNTLYNGWNDPAGTDRALALNATDWLAGTGSTGGSPPPGGGSCASPGQQLLGNPGFETGTASPWAVTAGVLNNSTSEPAHSGSWDAWLDGYGTTHADTLAQPASVPGGCTTYQASFWLHTDTSETTTATAFDTLKVQVLNSSGTVLATLATFSNLSHATGYQQHAYNLSAYAGQAITLKFTGTEDSSLQTSFVIDDTAVNVS